MLWKLANRASFRLWGEPGGTLPGEGLGGALSIELLRFQPAHVLMLPRPGNVLSAGRLRRPCF